ncbi:nitrate- and nitrite sensing domain-containing protein [Streptomyces sp. NPDC052051]|uniref:sensor histidine kinase n=1 Tax=Streptomyces sp. NPDC052051 TaxID=3154649 RepID=UPI00342413BB
MRRSKNGPEPSARGNFTPPPREVAPADESGPESTPLPRGRSRFSLHNWRMPAKLNAILLIPVLVGLVMGGFQVRSSIDTWQQARDAEKVAKIVAAAGVYAEALLNERDLSAEPLLKGDRNSSVVKQARELTDEKADAFHQEIIGRPAKQDLERRLSLLSKAEPKLAQIRRTAFTRAMDPVKTEEGYVEVEHLLMEFSNELGLGTGNITAYGRSVYALALAKGAESLQRSIGMHLLVKPSTDAAIHARQITAFTSYKYLEGVAQREYVSGATEADAAHLTAVMKEKAAEGTKQAAKDTPAGQTPLSMDQMVQAISSGLSPDELKQQGITPKTWTAASTLTFEAYSQVENELIKRAVDDAGSIATNAQRDAYINGAVVLLALLAAVALAGVMARQMTRSMRELRSAAFDVAEQRLPMLVDQLSRTDPGRVDTKIVPIPISSTDEIGEVARAFDQVHREAVRLASEQALLRGNINAIFTNLSRRNQSLIEGQLTLITDLENNEADPDQLENLFKLDHLATRMRRNGENLLVLAGQEPGRRWDQPVPLVDVLRAASSEVEQYERIELSGVPEAEIHGRAVTDLVHLLAELLENATTFSSPQTKVRVTATRLPDGRIMIEIHDKGIGLTPEDFADINHKLANPPTVDAAISQRMGLFVVGRLSDRHDIRVQLRPSGEQAGTTSLVMLPDAITHGGGGEHPLQTNEFTVSQIIPEKQPFAVENAEGQAALTAAELGFDDSRYSDPVGRSLMREERRAALEAQTHGTDRAHEAHPNSAPYPNQFEAPQQPAYDNGQDAYQEQRQAYDPQQTYEQPQQPAYGEQYYPAGDGQAQGENFTPPGGYPESGYAEQPQHNGAVAPATSSETYSALDGPSYQDDWPQQNAYQNGYGSAYTVEPESAQAADASTQDRVGFDHPEPASTADHGLTDAGLPRRGGTASAPSEANGDQHSANGEGWQQASQPKKPKAAGVTSSGLPRRVPKANLIEGAPESTPQGGPQVSRSPEDVRGRLSNLRRGVQRGRSAGSDTNGQGFGPDSTYNQER